MTINQVVKAIHIITTPNQEEVKAIHIITIPNQIIQITIPTIIPTNNTQMIIHTENQKANQRKIRLEQNVLMPD